jgi:hypothetical protein
MSELNLKKDSFLGDECVKMDIAIEIMAEMIAGRCLKQMSEENPETILKLEEELSVLIKERDLMYQGDPAIIEKILTVYAAEIREIYKD